MQSLLVQHQRQKKATQLHKVLRLQQIKSQTLQWVQIQSQMVQDNLKHLVIPPGNILQQGKTHVQMALRLQ